MVLGVCGIWWCLRDGWSHAARGECRGRFVYEVTSMIEVRGHSELLAPSRNAKSAHMTASESIDFSQRKRVILELSYHFKNAQFAPPAPSRDLKTSI